MTVTTAADNATTGLLRAVLPDWARCDEDLDARPAAVAARRKDRVAARLILADLLKDTGRWHEDYLRALVCTFPEADAHRANYADYCAQEVPLTGRHRAGFIRHQLDYAVARGDRHGHTLGMAAGAVDTPVAESPRAAGAWGELRPNFVGKFLSLQELLREAQRLFEIKALGAAGDCRLPQLLEGCGCGAAEESLQVNNQMFRRNWTVVERDDWRTDELCAWPAPWTAGCAWWRGFAACAWLPLFLWRNFGRFLVTHHPLVAVSTDRLPAVLREYAGGLESEFCLWTEEPAGGPFPVMEHSLPADFFKLLPGGRRCRAFLAENRWPHAVGDTGAGGGVAAVRYETRPDALRAMSWACLSYAASPYLQVLSERRQNAAARRGAAAV